MVKPSTSEMELLRLLQHARACDGVRCATCRQIDLLLGDWPHSAPDPGARLANVDRALRACHEQAERLYAAVEGSALPSSTRSAFAQLLTWLGKTRELLVLAPTRSDAAPAPPSLVRRPPVRRAVVITLEMSRR